MTKVFNKRNAKRVTAILLAVVAVVSSIFIIPTASAAGKEVTVTFDYCYDTGGNIISFVKYTEHGGYTVGTVGEELCRIYADGKDAYCIEPGHSLYSGNTLTTDASAAWNALSKAQKKAVNLALLFGKSGSSSSLVGTDGQKWIATQLVVWEFCTGCRDASTFKLSNSKFIDGITAGDHNPNVKTNYNKIIAKLNSYNVIPSFSYDTQAKAKNSVKELKYSDGKYSLTLTDSNKILSDYTFKKTGDVSVSVSGNSITLTSTKAIPDALVFSATKKMPNVTTTLVACGSSSKQDVVTGVQSDTETKTAYFAVKTSAGSLRIVKTSDDGKVDGVKFKITGADNYSKTVTTNAKGEFQIDDLKVGTYTVTEVTEDRYEDQKSQTVKVESGKTATVKFSNILKRGDLEVVKTSEDNFNEGVKFHLYGTSLSGANVDEYATTDKNGVANFKNILVSGDKPYTLEEVDTATLTAFYTPPVVISAIYKAMEQMGFKEGNILEPSCGIGNFIGMLPQSMENSRVYGVEIDKISAGIAQQLYQRSSIAGQPFEEANIPDSFFDAVVGNVPFGDFSVADKRYDKNHLDNAIDGIESRLNKAEEQLANTQAQLETAKVEVEKPFAQEDELQQKMARLTELNALLDMNQGDVPVVGGEPDEGDNTPEKKRDNRER